MSSIGPDTGISEPSRITGPAGPPPPRWRLLASTSVTDPGSTGATTPPINTTGADLIVVACAHGLGNSICSDSAGNTWVATTTGNTLARIFYAYDVVPSTAHTFTITFSTTGPQIALAVLAFSGALTPGNPGDQFSQATWGATASSQPGVITPTADDELIVNAFGLTPISPLNPPFTISIDSGFTVQVFIPGFWGGTQGLGVATLIQSPAAPINPTVTRSAASGNATSNQIVSFFGAPP